MIDYPIVLTKLMINTNVCNLISAAIRVKNLAYNIFHTYYFELINSNWTT